MKHSSFAKQCLDLLRSHEAKQWIAPFVDMIVEQLYPYAYLGIALVCLLLVLMFVQLTLVIYLVRQVRGLAVASV
jgi:hypothetical protein